MNSSLSGKTVVVIGGSSGIGAAVAKAAAARGAQVVLAGRRLVSGTENGLRSEPVDVTDAASLQGLFEAVGRFDHLVYTSGPSVRAKPLVDTDLDEAQENFNVKLWGSLRAIQLALPFLDERGSITLTSGQLGRKLAPGQFIKPASMPRRKRWASNWPRSWHRVGSTWSAQGSSIRPPMRGWRGSSA